MWLNEQKISAEAIRSYRQKLRLSCPRHVVIEELFEHAALKDVCRVLRESSRWQTQQHTYSALYVDAAKWLKTPEAHRFVQRDVWQRSSAAGGDRGDQLAMAFLDFLRGAEFMALLSRIFRVQLTDRHVAKPEINTNYFRLGGADFVNRHVDESPGREICLLLYLNEDWRPGSGGELVFAGRDERPLFIAPHFNRCVLFDPSSAGAEHWVNAMKGEQELIYRYNVTSWYWSE